MPSLRAVYSDARGTTPVVIENDGHLLTTTIRGVAFEGTDFDSLTAATNATELTLSSHGDLCDCTLVVDIPVRLKTPGGVRFATVKARIELGKPDTVRGGIDSEWVTLEMSEPEFQITTPGRSGWFEDELLSLSAQLPFGFFLLTCITCGLSDYSPYGHGSFGYLACFRHAKADYRAVRSKMGIFALWNRMTEYVQETHYCDEFETRPPGRGYRG